MDLDSWPEARREDNYGTGRHNFITDGIDRWLTANGEDAGIDGPRADFLKASIRRWQTSDWGDASTGQIDTNHQLVEDDEPGIVVGVYKVPAELEPPGEPLLVIRTDFKGRGRNRRLEAFVVWGEAADEIA